MNIKILTVLLTFVSLLLALIIGSQIGSSDYLPIILLAVAGFGLLALLLQNWLPVLTIAGITVVQRPAILFGFGYWEVLAGTCVAAALIGQAFQKKAIIAPVSNRTVLCLSLALSLLPLHLLATKLGIGNPTGGGVRLSIYAISVILFSWMIFNSKAKFTHIEKLPLIGTIPPLVFLIFDLTTFFFPSTLSVLGLIYPQNDDAIIGITEGFRLRGTREIGIFIVILAGCYFVTGKTVSTFRFLLIYFSIPLGAAFIMVSGFRSYFIVLAVVVISIGLMKSRLLLLVIAISGILGLSALSGYQTFIDRLPFTIQRAISWFPGDWETHVRNDGSESLNYRKDLWDLWYDLEFGKIWLLGAGQRAEGMDLEEVKAYTYGLSTLPYTRAIGAELYRISVQRNLWAQNLHSGFVGTIDYIGVVGLSLILIGIVRCGINVFYLIPVSTQLKPWEIWVILAFCAKQPYFWLTGLFHIEIGPIVVLCTLIECIRINNKDLLNNRKHPSLKKPFFNTPQTISRIKASS